MIELLAAILLHWLSAATPAELTELLYAVSHCLCAATAACAVYRYKPA